MKKLTAVLLVLAMVITGAFAQGAAETPAAAPVSSSSLIEKAKAEGELVVYVIIKII